MQRNFEPSRMFLPDDYDQTSPMEQWKTQNPVGHQVIFQMVTEPKKTTLSTKVVRKALENAISQTDLPGIAEDSTAIQEYTDLGEGCVLVKIWSSGSIVVTWDGRSHIDVNLFTYEEDIDQCDEFEGNFQEGVTSLTTMLRDEQPRGAGRLISFQRDLVDNRTPHWA